MRNRIMLTIIMIVSFSLPVYAQQENRVWLPIIGTGATVKEASAERPKDIPEDWIQHGKGPDGAPSWGPPFDKPVSQNVIAELGIQVGPDLIVAGEETIGQTIDLSDGKKIKLPDNVYVEHYVISVFCIAGYPCPDTPHRILAIKSSTSKLIMHKDGRLLVPTENPIVFARIQADFISVIEQVGQPAAMDPALPFLKEWMKTHAIKN